MKIEEYYISVQFVNWEKTDEFLKLAWSNQIPVDLSASGKEFHVVGRWYAKERWP